MTSVQLYACSKCGTVRDHDPKRLCCIAFIYAYGPVICGGIYAKLPPAASPDNAPFNGSPSIGDGSTGGKKE